MRLPSLPSEALLTMRLHEDARLSLLLLDYESMAAHACSTVNHLFKMHDIYGSLSQQWQYMPWWQLPTQCRLHNLVKRTSLLSCLSKRIGYTIVYNDEVQTTDLPQLR